tara:strand:+ start:139 stop:1248 length:1110 start_codon:yes stop_codon:yes gene_type:complete
MSIWDWFDSDPVPAPQPIVINPSSSAGEQASWNEEAALKSRALSLIDQYTPEGSLTYSTAMDDQGNPVLHEGIPQMRATQTLSPDQQRLFDSANTSKQNFADIAQRQLGQVGESLSNPFTLDQFGAAPQVNENVRNQTRDSMIARMQPQMDRDRARMQTQLINQGFTSGSEGYDSAFDESNRARNDMYLGADAAAGNEMSRLFGLESNQRDRSINEAMMERNVPMSELASFMSGSQPGTPSFVPTPQGQVSAPDFQGIQQAGASTQNAFNMGQYNAQNASDRANTQGLYGILGAGAGAAGYKWSDRRLKTNIVKIGERSGLNLYEYNYIWGGDKQTGFMADEVKIVYPEAVARIGEFDAVNYGAINGGS